MGRPPKATKKTDSEKPVVVKDKKDKSAKKLGKEKVAKFSEGGTEVTKKIESNIPEPENPIVVVVDVKEAVSIPQQTIVPEPIVEAVVATEQVSEPTAQKEVDVSIDIEPEPAIIEQAQEPVAIIAPEPAKPTLSPAQQASKDIMDSIGTSLDNYISSHRRPLMKREVDEFIARHVYPGIRINAKYDESEVDGKVYNVYFITLNDGTSEIIFPKDGTAFTLA